MFWKCILGHCLEPSFCYCIYHMTFPLPLFLPLLDCNFKMSLLTQFCMDFLEISTVDSYICCLSACIIKLYNITLFQFQCFLASRGQFPRSNSFTSCNMPQSDPKLCLHLLLDIIEVLKINCATEMTIWFMVAVAMRWLGDCTGLGLVQCNSYYKSDCHLSCTIDFEHLNNVQEQVQTKFWITLWRITASKAVWPWKLPSGFQKHEIEITLNCDVCFGICGLKFHFGNSLSIP
jgi:hypothetical protein